MLGMWWLLVGLAGSPTGHKAWNPGKPYHDSLLLLFLAPSLWLIWKWRRELVRGLMQPMEGLLLLAFLSWATLSVAWAPRGKLGDALIVVLYVLIFVAVWASLLAGQPRRFRQLLFWAGVGLGASALVAMAVFPLRSNIWQAQDRLMAFGTLNNPNLAAFAFGAALVWMTQLSVGVRWQRVLHVLSMVMLTLFVVMTFSRSTWLALIVSQAVMLLATSHRRIRRRAAVMLALALVVIALGGWQYMRERGLSYRPQILEQSLALFSVHPWLGLGMGGRYTIQVGDQVLEHSHNIFSHLVIVLGLPGVMIFAALWLVVGWRAWRYRHVVIGRVLLALWIYASVAWQFDAPQLLRRPDVEWLLGWLPLAMSVGLAWRIRDHHQPATGNALSKPGKVSLVVLTYNWPDALAKVLASIPTQSRLPDEVIVADDGSTEATRDVIERAAASFPVPIRHVWQEDLGFRAARCRNRGMAASRGDYIVLIDGDMVLHPQFVADHLALAEPGYFLQGGRFKTHPRETVRLLAGGRPVFAPWADVDFNVFDGIKRLYAFRSLPLARWKSRARNGGRVMSCNMSFWRDDLLRVNGFDERMEGYGAEDRELAARLGNAGVRRRQLKWAALAAHLDHPTRAQPDVNDMSLPNNRLFRATVVEHITRCEHGIDAHLAELSPDQPSN
ncbi:glycosyltransferase [Dyella subtropica]|uniref:glycosyltransferase n=1 Tax=Dyella subtropica TaxID=2992127 RepID=UPI002B1CD180|nr:glycosyltransferase [Dyella subtropica]